MSREIVVLTLLDNQAFNMERINRRQVPKQDQSADYQILVQGELDPKWADWFAGFELSYPVAGQTMLRGQVIDQAALLGVLNKIQGLGLRLLLVVCVNGNDGHSSFETEIYEW